VNGFERRALGGGGHALVSLSLERAGFLAAFAERTGGSSAAPFHSLNVSFSVGDDPDAVAANRRRVIQAFDMASFAVPGLVHGTTILPVGPARAGDGFRGPADLLRANVAFQAVAVPGGHHVIDLRYRPATLPWGLVLTGLAVAASCFVLWAARR